MKIEYVPSGITVFESGHFVDDKSITWYKEDSIMKHNWLLESYFYWSEKTHSKLNLRKDVKFFGDSGGFSIGTGKIEDLNPVTVLRWEEEHCDYGLSLDYPPFEITDDGAFRLYTQAEAKDNLQRTAKNMEIMQDNRNPDVNLKLMFCVHGFDSNYLDSAVSYLDKYTLEDFDGIAISRKGSNPYTFLEQMWWAKENLPKGKHLHILGISGFQTTPLIHFIFRNRDDVTITYDSTSYLKGGKRREVMNPLIISENIVINEETKTLLDFCHCPVCNQIKDKSTLLESGTKSGILLNLHNLFLFLQYNKALNTLCHHEEEYISFNTKFSSKNKELLNFVLQAEKIGFDKTKQRYIEKFSLLEKKQNNLYDF